MELILPRVSGSKETIVSSGSELSDRGWGCLFVLMIIAISSLPSWCFYVGLLLVILLMVGKYKETGNVPSVSDEVGRFFTENRRKRRRRRRR